jgi:dipeptidyl aminopeptidase/acylaminoacyl peptidase
VVTLMMTDNFLHQLMTLPTVEEARLSPDKRWAAFLWYLMHENIDVFLVPADGSQLPIAMTHNPEATELVSWTPDSKAVIRYYIQRGFNVLGVNYRGSTGFGLKYSNAIKKDGWGGREQADIATGAQSLKQGGLAQPGKVGVTGTSYGGYSAWYLITHYPPEIIAAAAPISGMTDLVVDYHTTRPDLRPLDEEMMGGRPDEVPERYYERSPINYVQDIRGKLFIVQGALDPNVSPENVRQVSQRLDYRNIPYEVLIFDDEGHGVIKPANQEVLYERLANFFEQSFGG